MYENFWVNMGKFPGCCTFESYVFLYLKPNVALYCAVLYKSVGKD